jgi:hypothetical protein
MPAKVELPVVTTLENYTKESPTNSISAAEYADHMEFSLTQLETVTLMLQVLEQADGGVTPSE